ncbi:MAG: LacI family transcriptional regulator [Chloroflexi bacterium]|nr:LacI family transcriptional regulator [Chloroflexota bacterium]
MKVTLRDLAERLGLSISTVSRALADDPRISRETKRQVTETAKQLRYRPSVLARGLKTRRTMTIGLIVIDVTYPVYASIARGVEDEAHIAKYNVIICNSDSTPGKEYQYIENLLERGVDGVLLTPVGGPTVQWDILEREAIPFVLIEGDDDDSPSSSVRVDHARGGHLATDYLVGLGHQDIGLLCGPTSFPWNRQLYDGYRQALDKAGIPFRSSLVIQADLDLTSSYYAASELLSSAGPPTAIFAGSDVTAYGTYRALSERNLSVPGDISVIGYGDIPIARVLSPPLTTISYDSYQIGKTSARRLFKILEDPEGCGTAHLVIQPELVVRKSAAPPRKGSKGQRGKGQDGPEK